MLKTHLERPLTLEQSYEQLKKNIIALGDKPYVSVEEQLALLEQLSEFEFGKFLILHRGVNGYWTHYFLTYPFKKHTHLHPLEKRMLESFPTLLATQERFQIFLRENQKAVKNNAALACIPSGMMGDLLYLNYEGISSIHLIGIDYDPETLSQASELAEQKNLSHFCSYLCSDAWQLPHQNEFDLISSNGLNIYEPDDAKVTALYHTFYTALKPGGKLVTSYLTPPPLVDPNSPWKMDKIDLAAARLQKIIFADILSAKFNCFRTENATKQQLLDAGFKDITFINDKAHIFPTVVAYK